MTGTTEWDIRPIKLSVISFQNFLYLFRLIKFRVSVQLVNKERVIAFLFFSSQSVSNQPLELIFSNVWGPSPFMSITRNKYYVSFVDHFSKFTWLYPIPNKSSVMPIFCSFQKLVERQFNCKIKSI